MSRIKNEKRLMGKKTFLKIRVQRYCYVKDKSSENVKREREKMLIFLTQNY